MSPDYSKQQIVIFDTPYYYKFENCKIFDRENWVCLYNDNRGEVKVVDGKFKPTYDFLSVSTPKPIGGFTVQLSKFQYLVREFIWWDDAFCAAKKKHWDAVLEALGGKEEAYKMRQYGLGLIDEL